MLKFGMNTLLWSINFDDNILPVCEQLKEIGFDGIEAPIFDHDVKKYERLGKRLKDLGLGATAVTCRYPEDNPISTDPKVRALGVTNSCKILDCCHALGVEVLAGPYHSCMGLFTNTAPTADEWKWSVDGMRQVAEYAKQAGVMLGVEYLNRFEIYLLNTAADTARYVRDVNHPNCRMMYDTFHANIEEKNIGDSVRVCKNETIHIHISENDRGIPGTGHVDWNATFDALKETGYKGWLTIEAFGSAFPEIAAATKIWRKLFPDEMGLARDGLAFMKKKCAERGMK